VKSGARRSRRSPTRVHLIGHSPHVTELALEAALLAGFDGVDDLRVAALLHDVGRAGGVSSISDRPSLLGTADSRMKRQPPACAHAGLSPSRDGWNRLVVAADLSALMGGGPMTVSARRPGW
jgi:predicted HD phosphohydrolase